jgi:Phosphotransferase enzyme family
MDTSVTRLPPEACLDRETLQPLLQRELRRSHGSGEVRNLHIGRVRRNTSRRRNPHPLTFCVELDWCADGQAPQARLLYGKVFRDGASGEVPMALSTLHLPELDLVFWQWPHDPSLPQLPALMAPGSADPWWSGQASRVQLLRYTPEMRASLRYTDERDPKAPKHLYAKTFAGAQGEAIDRRIRHFWALSGQQADAPQVAEPLGYDAATRTVWQAAVDGRPLADLIAQPGDADGVPGLVAALAAVHQAPVSLAEGQSRGLEHWLAELPRRVNKVARAAPELAPAVNAAVGPLLKAGQALPPFATTLIHGDCHPDQFLVAGDRIVMFDFDEFSVGDPMEDLGAFLVKLAPQARRRWGTALERAYALRWPGVYDGQRLRWHEAVQHLLQACRAFTFQVPQWREVMAQHLQLTARQTRNLQVKELAE